MISFPRGMYSFCLSFFSHSGRGRECADDRLRYRVDTFALSGNISTQHCRHKFENDKMERDVRYQISIRTPNEYKNNTNVTLYINIENHLLQEYDKFYSSFILPDTELSRAVSPPGSFRYYALERKISEDGVSNLQVDLMPGFRLTWHYNKKLDQRSFPAKLNKMFKR